jgi:hypothetical protein
MMIDTNAYLGPWPFRHLPESTLDALLPMMSHHGVGQAWVGSMDGLFHKDVAGVNARLVEVCASAGEDLLLPFGSVNLSLPAWEEDLRRCSEEHGMRGIRVHPNYHGYTLDDSRFKTLVQSASDLGLLIQLVVCMEDERMMHPLMQVPHVDVTPLTTVLRETPKAKVQLLNAFRVVRGADIEALVATEQVCFDIAWLERAAGIERIRQQIPMDRLLFGTNSPLFYYVSSILKLKESLLSEDELFALEAGNAQRILQPHKEHLP